MNKMKDMDLAKENLVAPLIKGANEKAISHHHDDKTNYVENGHGSVGMVLLSTAVAICGSFEFGCCVGYSAPTQSALREDLKLSIAEYSLFGSLVTIGAMFGAITSGRIADHIGRKWTMRMSACICIMGWLAIYLAQSALPLDVGRLLTGYGIGTLSYLVPVFISEIAPKNIRGGLAISNQLMITAGLATSFFVGSFVTWRTLAIIGVIPCIVLMFGLFVVPESPRWLAKIGKHKEFEDALRKLRGKDTDIYEEAAEIEEYIQTLESLPKARFLDLFQQMYIRSLVANMEKFVGTVPYEEEVVGEIQGGSSLQPGLMIGVGLMVLQQFGGINGYGFYVNETFIQAGFSSGKLGTSIYGIIQVPITLIGAMLMDKCGRRPLLLVSSTGTSIGCLLTATGFLLKSNGAILEVAQVLVVAGVMIYISAFSIGMGAIPWVMMSEIFPINVKGAAGGLVVLICWLGAWLISYTFNFMITWSTAGTFYIYAGFNILTILFVAKIVPETKGKTLEEIQASINA